MKLKRTLNPDGSPSQQGFIYDSLGRLYRLDGSWSSYSYDGCGRMKTDGTKAEAHVWGGDTLVYAGDAVFRKSGGGRRER